MGGAGAGSVSVSVAVAVVVGGVGVGVLNSCQLLFFFVFFLLVVVAQSDVDAVVLAVAVVVGGGRVCRCEGCAAFWIALCQDLCFRRFLLRGFCLGVFLQCCLRAFQLSRSSSIFALDCVWHRYLCSVFRASSVPLVS